VLPLIFMTLGSLIGSFEEVIPLTAIVVALSLRLGWDRFLGVGMSLLAVGCGFAVGVMNPFTTGIAQTIAGLPIFSGAWFRLIAFALVYAMLMAFLLSNARRCERATLATTDASNSTPEPDLSHVDKITPSAADSAELVENPLLPKALRAFVVVFVIGIAAIIACSVVPVPGLSNLVFPVCALTFLLCGIIAPLLTGCGLRQWSSWFLGGTKAIAPGALLVLMASSISFMLTEGHVLDTIIYYASTYLADKPGWLTILGIYLLVMLLEFAIPSGSAKAFLLVPLLTPLVDLIGISRQLAVIAYIFGDGFTNVLYPTNPALLIALSLSGLSYGQWIRRAWPFFLGLLGLTSAMLLVGLAIGYA
ncbi:MAG: AbgT family transporter, partial [Coriobacteriia bacterium]|nr:AbgT family transporter [Coriobacteriia bacterium]